MVSPESLDDEQLAALMRAAQDGDGPAYGTLLRELTVVLRRIVRARSGLVAESEVEDVVQEILLSVHAVRATYDPSRPFLPWLLAIARHRMLDAARRGRRRSGREISADDPGVTFREPVANTPDDSVGDVEALAQAIASLPAGQRQAIELLKLQQLSLQEASARSGQSVGSLKVATHRALLALRRMLVGD